MSIIEIWKPKYSTKEILISTLKVVEGDNYIRITQDRNYFNKLLKVHSDIIKLCPTQKNGSGEVYLVPLTAFEILTKKIND